MGSEEGMQGKICLVTGATSGIGLHTALGLAAQGARVVLVGRSQARIAKAMAFIQGETKQGQLDCLLADLASQGEVRRLADQVLATYPRLDVLVNNAGGFFLRRELTPDGIEMTFGLNHLSYFLLTQRLEPLLRASTPARVVNVSSEAHRSGRMHFDDLELKRGYTGFRAYNQSKLANLLFTFELSRRLEGSGVTANALHPGFVATNFAKNNGLLVRLAMSLIFRLVGRTPAQGAETPVYLASSEEAQGVTGTYLIDKRVVSPSRAARDLEAAARLWSISMQMTGGAFG